MKVFVTGATGVIGHRAVLKLVEAGHQVTGVARSEPKAVGLRQLGATPIQVSLFERPALTDAIRGYDAVANLATNVPPLDQAMNPQAWGMSNRIRTEGSVHLTRAAVEAGCQMFIQESITFPYADGGENWIDETAPIARPVEMASSGVAEEQAEWFSQAGGQGIVLRFALFYASDSSHSQAFQAAIRSGQSPFMGMPGSYMSHIHAEDAASAVVYALKAAAGIYNIAEDEPMRRAALGNAVAAIEGVDQPSLPEPMSGEVPGSVEALMRSQRISNARFKDVTSWVPQYPSIREGWRQLRAAQ